MDIKAVVFSALAITLSGGLLWAGFTGADNRSRQEGEREYEEHTYGSSEHEAVRSLKQQGDILSLEEILGHARQHHEGRVLETELERKRGIYIYEVELVDAEGQVWEMKLDAQTGELLKEERER